MKDKLRKVAPLSKNFRRLFDIYTVLMTGPWRSCPRFSTSLQDLDFLVPVKRLKLLSLLVLSLLFIYLCMYLFNAGSLLRGYTSLFFLKLILKTLVYSNINSSYHIPKSFPSNSLPPHLKYVPSLGLGRCFHFLSLALILVSFHSLGFSYPISLSLFQTFSPFLPSFCICKLLKRLTFGYPDSAVISIYLQQNHLYSPLGSYPSVDFRVSSCPSRFKPLFLAALHRLNLYFAIPLFFFFLR